MNHGQQMVENQETGSPQAPTMPSLKAQLKAKQDLFNSLLIQSTNRMLQICVDDTPTEEMKKVVKEAQENLVNLLVIKQGADEEACSLVDTAIRSRVIVLDEKKLVLAENDKLKEKCSELVKKCEVLEKKNRELTENFKNGVQCLQTELLEASNKEQEAANERRKKLEGSFEKCLKTCSGEDEPASKKAKTEE